MQAFTGLRDERAKHHRRRARVVQGGVCGGDVEAEVGDEPGQAGHLSLRDLHHQPRQRGGVDDRVHERALEAAAHEPGVESVMAVLDQHGAVGETEESAPRVLEDRGADEHRAVDVVPAPGVGIDRRAAVDQRVEERQGALERETLRAQLENEERSVARGLDVEGDELRVLEPRRRGDLGRVHGDLLPRHRRGGAARLEIERSLFHRAIISARRAQAISSLVMPRSSRTAAP
jgi:hypothetical protein